MTDAELGPLADCSSPDAMARMEERRELFRIAGQSAMNRSRGGRDLTADARRWAQTMAALPPLRRPLSTGEPARARALPKAQP